MKFTTARIQYICSFSSSHSPRMGFIIIRLTEVGVSPAFLKITEIDHPSENAVRDLVKSLPQIRWAALRPELRPVLTNLKILDWVVAAVRAGTALDDSSIVGLTSLIDRLWERWVEGSDQGLARSHFLMRLSTLEAETLDAGVPRRRLKMRNSTSFES